MLTRQLKYWTAVVVLAAAVVTTSGRETTETEDRPFYVAAERAGKTGICNLHRVPMKKTAVPNLIGIPNSSGTPTYSTRIRQFPHAQNYALAGCEADPYTTPKRRLIYMCPACTRDALLWAKQHPREEWSKRLLAGKPAF